MPAESEHETGDLDRRLGTRGLRGQSPRVPNLPGGLVPPGEREALVYAIAKEWHDAEYSGWDPVTGRERPSWEQRLANKRDMLRDNLLMHARMALDVIDRERERGATAPGVRTNETEAGR